MKTKTLGVTALICLAVSIQSCGDGIPAYKNPDNPVEVRVADLLKRMTLEEKIAQMQDLKFKDFSVDGKVDTVKMDSVLKGMSYASVFGSRLSVEQMQESMFAINKYMAEHNRLGNNRSCWRSSGYIQRIGQGRLVSLWGRPHVPL